MASAHRSCRISDSPVEAGACREDQVHGDEHGIESRGGVASAGTS